MDLDGAKGAAKPECSNAAPKRHKMKSFARPNAKVPSRPPSEKHEKKV